MLKISGQIVTPAPTAYTPTVVDVDLDSERTVSGLLIRNRVAVKRKIPLKFEGLSRAEAAFILQLVSPVFFTVEYDDPQTGKQETGVFYASDRPAEATGYDENGEVWGWRTLSFNLIER